MTKSKESQTLWGTGISHILYKDEFIHLTLHLKSSYILQLEIIIINLAESITRYHWFGASQQQGARTRICCHTKPSMQEIFLSFQFITNSKMKNQIPLVSPVSILWLFATRSQQNAIFLEPQIAIKKSMYCTVQRQMRELCVINSSIQDFTVGKLS